MSGIKAWKERDPVAYAVLVGMFKGLIFIGLLVMCFGCSDPDPTAWKPPPEPRPELLRRVTVAPWTKRIIDCEVRTVCYIYTNEGISCVPLLIEAEECR